MGELQDDELGQADQGQADLRVSVAPPSIACSSLAATSGAPSSASNDSRARASRIRDMRANHPNPRTLRGSVRVDAEADGRHLARGGRLCPSGPTGCGCGSRRRIATPAWTRGGRRSSSTARMRSIASGKTPRAAGDPARRGCVPATRSRSPSRCLTGTRAGARGGARRARLVRRARAPACSAPGRWRTRRSRSGSAARGREGRSDPDRSRTAAMHRAALRR